LSVIKAFLKLITYFYVILTNCKIDYDFINHKNNFNNINS
jgi:hypothetical protein